ncbi:MAG: SLC13 family permease [Pirellulaceae bacterium]
MNPDLAVVLALLAMAIVMFAINRPRMDAVALIVICLLPLTGVIEMSEALAGFSDSNIVLIAALFVLGEGLVRTGVARQLGDWLVAKAGSSQPRLISLLMSVVCGLGATMSSTAVTAIFIPVVLRISRSTKIAPSKLMMPLSTAALISGMITLVATAPNLVVNSELVRRGHDGFHFFSFTPFGVPVLICAIGYMLIARRWLPEGEDDMLAGRHRRPTLKTLVDRYHLADREHRLRILEDSPLAGKVLDEISLRQNAHANLISIQRNRTLLQPTAKTILQVGDILFVDLMLTSSGADEEQVSIENLRETYRLAALPLSGAHFADQAQEIGMAEVMIPADSDLIGKTIIEASFRTRFGLSAIGVRRGVEPLSGAIKNEPLRLGDTLLLIGPWKAIRQLSITGERDLVPLNLPAEIEEVLPVNGKMIHALLVLLLVVGLMVSGIIPNVQAAIIGCLLMGALGCIDFESGYRSIDWKTIVLIVGMLPFSIALQETGGVDIASDTLMAITSGMGPRGVLAALFLTTAILGLFISNTATAVLMAPVALNIAEHMDASPYPFAMIVALAASAAFMTPVSSPVNTLVVTPGGYRFGDFMKIGVPFTIVVLIISVLMVPWVLPL